MRFGTGGVVVSLQELVELSRKTAFVPKNRYVSTENLKPDFQGLAPYESEDAVKGIQFEVGDTLLANIRPYLKKTWLASFQGGCSADVICFHPKAIWPNYLYFAIANDTFISYVMEACKGSKMPRGDKNWVLEKPVFVPPIEEQQKASCFLALIDRRIEVQNKIIGELKTLEMSLIDAVFSQESSTSLARYIFETSERNRKREVTLVYSVSNRLGFVPQSEQFEDKEVASLDKENYKIVRRKTFAYNPARINVGSIGYYDEGEAVVISPVYVCFKVNGIDESILQQFFLSKAFYREMVSKLEGSVRQCLTFEGMKSIRIHLPNQGETKQLKLAQLISKKRRNEEVILASLSKQKASLLKQMFI